MVKLFTASIRLLSAQSRCAAFPSVFNTTGLASIETQYVTGGSTVALPTVGADCIAIFNMATTEVPAAQNVCIVSLAINTSSTSTTRLSIWLPDDHNGRFLGTGTGGISGCIDHPTLSYASGLGFASAGTDVGHTGQTAAPFLNAPEVLADYAWRGVHVEAVVGKQVTSSYYGASPTFSYYTGCSLGGRQGFYSAENFPEDFDGIIACSPALDFVKLFSWFAFIAQPFIPNAAGAMTAETWYVVRNETFKQCDHLDGAIDGIISYPADCKFDASKLLCSSTRQEPCLNAAQVDGLKKVYTDMYDPKGRFFHPRYDLGAEQSSPAMFGLTFGNQLPIPYFTYDVWRYAVYSDPAWAGTGFNWSDFQAGDAKLSKVMTGTEDLHAFKKRGGKILTLHGTEDSILPSGISTHKYALTAHATGKHDLDSWYALYLVPGHNHCFNTGSEAKGAWRMGQVGTIPEPRAASNTSEHNALLALVDWVEKGKEPERLVGMTDAGETREVCRYPSTGRWLKGVWKCGPR
ncbi:Tannase/feruloyl esterase [Auriculariales sp. MPI-PUGE-AT-0066]|nr:Tannase/feruloyl esterase [Auriculariales sp. MPI-PUGE-AT-0066]